MFLNSKISQIAHKVSGAKFERLATPTIRLTYGGSRGGFLLLRLIIGVSSGGMV